MPSIAELRNAGVTFEMDEAVAIVQQLISTLRSHPAPRTQPPAPRTVYGPPSAETVGLDPDGSVWCRGCRTTPTLSEVGIFLHSLLPPASPSVPGSLRYTIACALLSVDMPPFDSLSDFSRDLRRHEHGDRAAIVRRVLARAALAPAAGPFVHTAPRPARRPAVTMASRGGALAAIAACLVAGFALLTAERARIEPTPLAAMRTVPAVAAAPIAITRRGAPVHVAASVRQGVGPHARPARAIRAGAPLGRGIIAVHDVPSPPQQAAFSMEPPKGVMDRLRLGWLRQAFAAHPDR